MSFLFCIACGVSDARPLDGWEFRSSVAGEWRPIARPWNPPDRVGARDETYLFRTTLPEVVDSSRGIYFETVDEVFTVDLNGERIYTHGDFDREDYAYPGSPWHIIPLSPAASNGELVVRVKSRHTNLGVLGRPLIVSTYDYSTRMLRMDADRLFVFSVLVFGGLFLFAYAVAIRSDARAFLPLGLFAILMGVWIFCTTHVKQLFLFAPVAWKYTEYTALYCVPIVLASFMQRSLAGKRKITLDLIFYLHTAFLILALVLSVLDVTRITSTLNVFNPLLLGTMALFSVMVIVWMRAGDVAARYFFYGTLFLIVFAVHDVLSNMGWIAWRRAFSHWGALAFCLSLSILLIRQMQKTRQHLTEYRSELRIAREIQRSLLPPVPDTMQGVRLHAFSESALDVSGDYYDFGPVDDNRVGVLISDVVGHGTGAALIASMVRISFASALQAETLPSAVLTSMNKVLFGRCGGKYSTACYMVLERSHPNGTIHATFSVAGHPPPLLIRDGIQKPLEGKGLALGWMADTTFSDFELAVEPGDRIVLYSDGLVEARAPDGEIFGFERFYSIVQESIHQGPEAMTRHVLDRLHSFCKSEALEDDATLLVINLD